MNKFMTLNLKLKAENIENYVVNYKGHTIIVCNSNLTDIPEYIESQVIQAPYKLASKEFQNEKTIVDVDGVKLGGEKIIMIAGPCAVESRECLIETAHFLKSYWNRLFARRSLQTKNFSIFI